MRLWQYTCSFACGAGSHPDLRQPNQIGCRIWEWLAVPLLCLSYPPFERVAQLIVANQATMSISFRVVSFNRARSWKVQNTMHLPFEFLKVPRFVLAAQSCFLALDVEIRPHQAIEGNSFKLQKLAVNHPFS